MLNSKKPKELAIKVLAVVPARGGSKAVRRKNIRLLHEKPLISYVLEVATSSKYLKDIVVTSDNQDILEYVKGFWNVITRARPEELCRDEVTLDPVVYDAMTYVESITGDLYDLVVTLQPTSPTLKFQTLDSAIQAFMSASYDSCISVFDDTHLRWKIEDGISIPIYEQRVNRQWLPKVYKETGSFLISRRNAITPSSRLGKKQMIYPISREEAIDIDSEVEWRIVDSLLSRVSIAFVVNGNRKIGMGHIYRTLTLADLFYGNNIRFFTDDSDPQTIKLVEDRGFEIKKVTDEENLFSHLDSYGPDIVINDILDTDPKYLTQMRNKGYFIVNFEDLGEGSLNANLVFNALYEYSTPPPSHRFGAQYVCLGSDFLITPPTPFREPATTLLITFGGSDENNLTLKTCKILPKLFQETSLNRVLVVLGLGYAFHEDFADFLEKTDLKIRSRIEVYQSVENMAKLMRLADVAVTSNGRTVYELASLGVPGVTISQNDRETLHLFSRYSKGFEYLGVAFNVDEEKLFETVKRIINDTEFRRKMKKTLDSVDLRAGICRVKREILEEYSRWKYENPNNRQKNNY